MRLSRYILALLPAVAAATHLRVTIPPSPSLYNPNTLPPSTHASLTTRSRRYTAALRFDNSFDFPNVTTGSYLFDVHSHSHGFPPLRVDVYEKAAGEGGSEVNEVSVWGTFRGNEWGNKGEVVEVTQSQGLWWFEVKALGPKEYLLERPGFSPVSILKNPMMLLAVCGMVLVFGMPYLMDNLDPELKAEFEKSQRQAPSASQASNALQNFDAAAWLAGKTSEGTSSRSSEQGVTR